MRELLYFVQFNLIIREMFDKSMSKYIRVVNNINVIW